MFSSITVAGPGMCCEYRTHERARPRGAPIIGVTMPAGVMDQLARQGIERLAVVTTT
ncbi:hypothetical protein [Streptomyces atratus]|uniref:hypothetical protein n=1 Tax=Streptomyces atratus TaxID=1893 RepID=UPI0036535FAE